MGRCSRAARRHTLDYSAIALQVIATLSTLLRLNGSGSDAFTTQFFPSVAPGRLEPPDLLPWSLGYARATSSRLGSPGRDQNDHERAQQVQQVQQGPRARQASVATAGS